MSLVRSIQLMTRIDKLIRLKATGDQKMFAHKLGVSVSTLNNYLREMKSLNFPIVLLHDLNTYSYEYNGCMVKNLFKTDGDPVATTIYYLCEDETGKRRKSLEPC